MEVGTKKKPHKDRGSGFKSPSWRSPKRSSFMEKHSNSDNEGSLLLSNPMATEGELLSPSHASMNPEERTPPMEKSNGNRFKTRTKSPSFIRMIMGSIRHHKVNSQDEVQGDSSSDNEDSLSSLSQITFSASDSEKQRIEHLATLPRRPERKKRRKSKEKMGPSAPEVPRADDMDDTAPPPEDKNSGSPSARDEDAEMDVDMTDFTMDANYHSIGLDALNSLHDQLQILVRQDCDDEFAESAQDWVVTSLKNQIEELQKSVDSLQETEYSLRVSLKSAEVKALEAETKLFHQTQQFQRLEQRYYRLEHQYRLATRKNQQMEKTLQKTAVLNQIEQHSPSRTRRPQSARSPAHVPIHSSPNSSLSVKRHNSMEGLLPLFLSTTPTTSFPPRIPSSSSLSLGHTETRV